MPESKLSSQKPESQTDLSHLQVSYGLLKGAYHMLINLAKENRCTPEDISRLELLHQLTQLLHGETPANTDSLAAGKYTLFQMQEMTSGSGQQPGYKLMYISNDGRYMYMALRKDAVYISQMSPAKKFNPETSNRILSPEESNATLSTLQKNVTSTLKEDARAARLEVINKKFQEAKTELDTCLQTKPTPPNPGTAPIVESVEILITVPETDEEVSPSLQPLHTGDLPSWMAPLGIAGTFILATLALRNRRMHAKSQH